MDKKRKTVLVTGTFDGLHPGHINFFEQARKLGEQLIVIIARDQTVKKVKGREPIYSEIERQKNVEELEIVDEVILGDLDDPYLVVSQRQPSIVALGYDQSTFTERLAQELMQRGCEPEIVRLDAYCPEKYKSSKIRKK